MIGCAQNRDSLILINNIINREISFYKKYSYRKKNPKMSIKIFQCD